MKKKIIKSNGIELEVIENEHYEAPEKKVLSYFEWVTKSLDTSSKAAWDYKQGEINQLISEWNQSVCYGKDKLKETIDSLIKFNTALKASNKELRQRLAKLEGINVKEDQLI